MIYWVTNYWPDREGISREVRTLHEYFDGSIVHDWTDSCRFAYRERILSYHHALKFIVPLIVACPMKLVSHIFGDCAYAYAPFLRKKPVVMTATSLAVAKDRSLLTRIDKVVVESSRDLRRLLSLGVDDSKIALIYPGINQHEFTYESPLSSEFKILFASSPLFHAHVGLRGMGLLMDPCWRKLNDVRVTILTRKSEAVRHLMEESETTHIQWIEGIYSDINRVYGSIHATIAPYLSEIGNKSCPNSIVESLAAGKPVLVSSKVGIADLIVKEECGVVFEPTVEKMMSAIDRLRRRYRHYQLNARRVCEKYFPKEKFLRSYEVLYESVG